MLDTVIREGGKSGPKDINATSGKRGVIDCDPASITSRCRLSKAIKLRL